MGGIGLVMLAFGVLMLTKSWIAISSDKNVTVSFEDVQKTVNKKEALETNPSQGSAEQPTMSTMETLSPIEKKKIAMVDEIVMLLVKDSDTVDPDKAKEFILNSTSEMKDKAAIAYLDNMKELIEKAPVGKKGKFAIAFFDTYGEKMQKETAEAAEKKFEALKKLGTYGYLTLTGLLTVVSFGIILILAAIERNTRRRDTLKAQ